MSTFRRFSILQYPHQPDTMGRAVEARRNAFAITFADRMPATTRNH
jgi:hypothetical protein